MNKKHDIDWDTQPLGEMTDLALATRLGVCRSTVWEQRAKRKIPASQPSRQIPWDEQPLGEDFDRVLAKKLGVTVFAVYLQRAIRWIPAYKTTLGSAKTHHQGATAPHANINWAKQPLGKSTDKELATRLGVTNSAVANQRYKRGIPAYKPMGLVQWHNLPLGDWPDAEIAKKIGMSTAAVCIARRKLGITAWRSNEC